MENRYYKEKQANRELQKETGELKMEIKVGDYVRTELGTIGKVASVNVLCSSNEQYVVIETNKGMIDVLCSRIIKHSKNIIDLIEVGDYVNHEVVWSIGDKKGVETTSGYYTNSDIFSIVTKEQFKNMEYRGNNETE